MTDLHPRLAAEFTALRSRLSAEGALLPQTALQRYYDTFRRAFGPEVLRALNGPALLERMHAHGSRESLVYWLEFKDDDEFPSLRFGSIAGGNALKFGVFRRQETGTWVTRGSGREQVDLTLDQAVAIAERHRDQLLAAVDAVGAAAGGLAGGEAAPYLALQAELARVAPAVEDSAWGHKYLALLFPELLDDFHVASFQRWNLVRLLQLPPKAGDAWAEGRYACAGRFVRLTQALGLPMNGLTTLLNRRHGPPHRYWRVGTTDDAKARRRYWPLMRDRGVVAIGWPLLGDLSGTTGAADAREALAARVRDRYPSTPQVAGRAASQIAQFVAKLETGDRVLASDGLAILGVGEVAGPYAFDATTDFAHQRPVRWGSHAEWQAASAEALRTTVSAIRDYRTQVEAERHLLEDAATVKPAGPVAPTSGGAGGGAPPPPGRHTVPRLVGPPGLVQAVLERKGQAILYGPPGTGKTHWALRAARDLAGLRAFGARFEALDPAQRARIVEGTPEAPPLVRVTSFHPEYGYEDFIEGYRPRPAADGQLAFTLAPGVFRRLCTDAERSPEFDFYLVVDEINRGDVPRIFGELLTLLERDKRGLRVTLPASGAAFHVPPNVYLVGTMNTADRSIALLDVALRRRFGFIELMPDYEVFGDAAVAGLPLGAWLKDLNARVRRLGGGDARNRQIGHAFLLGPAGPITSAGQLAAVLRDDIVPLLEEYCYDDFGQLADVLGRTLVDTDGQRVRRELFEPTRASDLVGALHRPEIATAAAVVAATSPDDAPDVPDGDTQAADPSEDADTGGPAGGVTAGGAPVAARG